MAEKRLADICILTLIGLPGSGKTSLVEKLKDYLIAKDNASLIHVCYDQHVSLEKQAEMVELKKGGSGEDLWKEARKKIVNAVSSIVEGKVNGSEWSSDNGLVKTMLNGNEEEISCAKTVVVVIDDNNYYQSMRYEYYQMARQFEVGFCQLYLQCSLENAKKYNLNRKDDKKSVSDEVIEKMNEKMEIPDPLKNSWEQFSFTINTDGPNFNWPLEMCHTVLQLALANPVKPPPDRSAEKDESRMACTASVIHQSDKILRKRLAELLKEKSSEEKAEQAQYLNELRVEVMEDLKTGFTKLPVEVVKAVENREKEALEQLKEVIKDIYNLKIQENVKC